VHCSAKKENIHDHKKARIMELSTESRNEPGISHWKKKVVRDVRHFGSKSDGDLS